MATLVLSTVGTSLGGPVGGAIGSLIGQSIDQQMLAPPARGPRLGDLSVQTSAYGTQIPRVYGTMRVAGSVVWSTDLIESSAIAGAKGEPDVTYSYSVSMAVALSSRPLREIRRIWADGNLLRGEAGDFKTSTDFRFYDGGEDQAVDPLIGSIEGADGTPAYRGLAMAMFENLELADFGNRIPFLTFEVVADDGDPTLADILGDASDGCIRIADGRTLVGYSAIGKSMSAAIRPLVDTFDVELVDACGLIGPADGETLQIGEDELGTSANSSTATRMQRDQDPARSLPASVLVTYYDPERDYQSGLARADGGAREGEETRIELPAVLSAASARSLAEEAIARAWARRDRLKLSLPGSRIGLLPGARVKVPAMPGIWRVEQSTIDAMAVALELRPEWRPLPDIAADSGRSNAAADRVDGPASFALAELPSIDGTPSSVPNVYLAAASATQGWKPLAVEVTGPGWLASSTTSAVKSVLGAAISILPDGSTDLVDAVGFVDVRLVDAEQWLLSCDDEALMAGANLALLGGEILQFGVAKPLGAGAFRLSRLLRGRGGTEWATAGHQAGEAFVLLEAASLRQVPLPDWASGSEFEVLQPARQGSASAALKVSGDSLRPWSPVGLRAALTDGGDLAIGWIRRSRVRCGWLDDIDMPLGERLEQYDVTITAGEQSLDYSCGMPAITISAVQLGRLGTGTATISVRQVGDWGASRPATVHITLS
ncbi:phage tail protein [Sphingomonas sp.]|uniref:phage tail protein n=1 Tax=Sphingomonas sp. TaxID=28214 RepID=UPI0025E8D136|nr:phage tail protein [Sphingomonas sp.]MBV9529259.1 phage tail protein [Sphingomonas sp.]